MVLLRSSVSHLLCVSAFVACALAAATPRSTDGAPLVTLDYGTFQGLGTSRNVQSFLGIPFAQPPVGDLRFRNPLPPQSFSGIQRATTFGNSCPQQPPLAAGESFPKNAGLTGVLPYLGKVLPRSSVNASEDCLYINVMRPAPGVTSGSLPVIVWTYGGAFENGDGSGYDGSKIVLRSLDLKLPVIYVSYNYRVNAFGFLGGKEVQAAGLGNFGLFDQRLALEWVQKYIGAFGGDPEKVILWGESAGSVSVMLQMVAYDGQLNGLFQGAVMQSGSATPLRPITSRAAQDNYDLLVRETNCGGATDTLACLRRAPFEAVLNAVLQTPPLLSYRALNTAWKPLIDGIFVKQSIRQSLAQGKYARVPAILGDVDDEGTLFSLYSFNVTNEPLFVQYIHTNFLLDATEAEVNKVRKVYPKEPSLGSPYDVGDNDTLTPEYKRIASFQGDYYFQAPRRYALRHLSRTQGVWSFLWRRNKYVPGLGSFHGSDLQAFYDLSGSSDWVGTDALVNFAYTLDPNAPLGGYPTSSELTSVYWPRYDVDSPQLLALDDGPEGTTLVDDTYRAKQIKFLNEVQDRLGL